MNPLNELVLLRLPDCKILSRVFESSCLVKNLVSRQLPIGYRHLLVYRGVSFRYAGATQGVAPTFWREYPQLLRRAEVGYKIDFCWLFQWAESRDA